MKSRSPDQLRRFFGVMAAAFQHWPEAHRFQPDNAEHLRAWLLVRAGHHTVKTFYLSEDATEYARVVPMVIATMLHKHAWCRARGNELHVSVPESIAFDKLGHHEFCKLNSDIDDIIKAELGIEADQLLRETERAA